MPKVCLSDEQTDQEEPGVYICNSIVNYLRHGNFICKSEEPGTPQWAYRQTRKEQVTAGMNRRLIPVELKICNSIVNELRYGNFICKSE